MNLANRAHFNDYWPPNFGWGGSHDPETHPSQLVPFTFNGVNFGQVHRDAAPVFTALLTELVPHIPGGLKAGSCWGYSTTDNLPDGTRSFHSFGIAIDVNWNVNHMGNNIPDAHGQWAIPRGLATSIAAKYGCEWGGNWTGGFHDNMHFEIHLPPADAASVQLTPEVTVSILNIGLLRAVVLGGKYATPKLQKAYPLLVHPNGMLGQIRDLTAANKAQAVEIAALKAKVK